MPEIDQIVIADGATPRANGTYDLFGASWDVIYTAQLPAQKPTLVLLLSLLLTADEAGDTHTLEISITGPDGSSLSSVRAEVAPVTNGQSAAEATGDLLRFETVLNARGLIFPEYGRYEIALLWDGDPLRNPLAIRVRTPPADPPEATD